jgi:hypothetical protein
VKQKVFLFLVLLAISSGALLGNDSISVRGKVVDKATSLALPGATLKFESLGDLEDDPILTVSSDLGRFVANFPSPGNYIMEVSYVGYKQLVKQVTITQDAKQNILFIELELDKQLLKEATVTGEKSAVQQQGDTTVFNANAFKTNPDADVSDLISKMPGFVKENGEMKAQGETIKKVTVDGKEYFGDDAAAALKNLPAAMVSQVQVFDEQSEQSRFTGFDDGNAQKTINIVTKSGLNQGQFGKIYGGYGTDNRFLAGANMNLFGKKRRIALIALSNNVNMQNFSAEDLGGVLGTNTGGRGRGMGGQRGGGSSSDFMVSQQNGITAAHAFGLNYTDSWSDKLEINASYFVNAASNEQASETNRELFLNDSPNQLYREVSAIEKRNINHKLNGRVVWTIDSLNSFVWRPRANLQFANNTSNLSGENAVLSELLNANNAINNLRTSAYDLNNELLYKRKLNKDGRTLSLSLKQGLRNVGKHDDLKGFNAFYALQIREEFFDQNAIESQLSNSQSADLVYTEPIGKKGQLMLSYNPSKSAYSNKREVFLLDQVANIYDQLDTALSNTYENLVLSHRIALSYSLKANEKLQVTLGGAYQYSQLQGVQSFPFSANTMYYFPAVLPNARLNYKFNKFSNLMFMYRSFNRLPSVNQLQPVIDNSNPMQLSSGNEQLLQEVRHFGFVRFGKTNPLKSKSMFVFVSGTTVQNFITNESFLSTQDGFEPIEGVVLDRGAQFNRPVNLDGYRNIRSFASYGIPVKKIKSNFNLNIGYTLSKTPGLINFQQNNTLTHNVNTGIVLSSNISTKLDFTASYTGNFNAVSYSFNPSQNNNFFFQNASFRFNWMPWKGLVINSETFYTGYAGLNDGFNQQIVLWNGGIGYKFLKSQRAEIRITAFDLLNQNNNISRVVTENYIQDSEMVVLTRFFLVNFTYQIRHFRSSVQS